MDLGATSGSLDGRSNLPSVSLVNTGQCYTGPNGGLHSSMSCANISDQQVYHPSPEEVKEFSEGLELLISKLIPAIDVSWKLHYQIASKVIFSSSKCLLFSKCLSSIHQEITNNDGIGGDTCPSESEMLSNHWRVAFEGLTGSILTIQRNQCWQVASAMFALFKLLENIFLDCVVGPICYAIKHFCLHAPRISW